MRFWVGRVLVRLGMALAELGDRLYQDVDWDLKPPGPETMSVDDLYRVYHYDDFDDATGTYRKGDC